MPGRAQFEERVRQRLAELEAEGLHRTLQPPSGIDFSSNDYLGLSRHPALLRSMLGSFLGSDGSAYEVIDIPAGGTREPLTPQSVKEGRNLMRMSRGAALFKQAVQGMAEAGRAALEQAGMLASEISWWIPHQANGRIIRDTGERLGFEPDRTINVVARYGNSSAATIPTAMTHAVTSGKLKAGDTILLTAAGAGLVTAGAVLRWG